MSGADECERRGELTEAWGILLDHEEQISLPPDSVPSLWKSRGPEQREGRREKGDCRRDRHPNAESVICTKSIETLLTKTIWTVRESRASERDDVQQGQRRFEICTALSVEHSTAGTQKGRGLYKSGGYLRWGEGGAQNACCEGQKRRQHTKALDLLVGSLASEFELWRTKIGVSNLNTPEKREKATYLGSSDSTKSTGSSSLSSNGTLGDFSQLSERSASLEPLFRHKEERKQSVTSQKWHLASLAS